MQDSGSVVWRSTVQDEQRVVMKVEAPLANKRLRLGQKVLGAKKVVKNYAQAEVGKCKALKVGDRTSGFACRCSLQVTQ